MEVEHPIFTCLLAALILSLTPSPALLRFKLYNPCVRSLIGLNTFISTLTWLTPDVCPARGCIMYVSLFNCITPLKVNRKKQLCEYILRGQEQSIIPQVLTRGGFWGWISGIINKNSKLNLEQFLIGLTKQSNHFKNHDILQRSSWNQSWKKGFVCLK